MWINEGGFLEVAGAVIFEVLRPDFGVARPRLVDRTGWEGGLPPAPQPKTGPRPPRARLQS